MAQKKACYERKREKEKKRKKEKEKGKRKKGLDRIPAVGF
jgi:hypothetical protein